MPTSEASVLKCLRELTAQMQALMEKVAKLQDAVQIIGEQNFQIRDVIKALADETAETREDLSEYGGVMIESSW